MDLEAILAIIERIGGDNPPTADELTTARTELARAIHAEARSEVPDLEVLTTLRTAFGAAGTALTEAEAAAAVLAEQVEEILADVEDPDQSEDPPAEDPPAEDPLVEDSEVPPVAGETPPVVTELPPPVVGAEPEAIPVAAAAARTPAARTLSLREAAARVRVRPPAPASETVAAGAGGASIYILGHEVTTAPTLYEAADAFRRFVRSPSKGRTEIIQFENHMDEGLILPGTPEGNTRLLDSFTSPEAVAAAGGCCSLPTPIRSQNVLSSTDTPIRNSLPTIGVQSTGAVTYFPAVCLPDDGVWTWLCSQDELVDPEDPETWKECAFIECPDSETTIVDAIYRCLTIGEFQRRFATEQWVAILQATLALQARLAELKTWTQMIAGVSSTHTADATGSVFTTWATSLRLAADTIRQDQRYTDVQLHQWLPGWMRGAIHNDLINRRLVDVQDPTVVDSMINSVAAQANTNLTFSIDTDPIQAGPQGDGPLADYPALASTILAPEGYYSYLEGGGFNIGVEIRDIDLARQNAVGAFAEDFGAVLARGCNAKRLNIPVGICMNAPGCDDSA
jgi:hypothetical protein